jgi:DNA-binding response OmpR family regulator
MATPRHKILAVDDTEPNLRLLRALLSGAGYEVATANSGTAGLQAAQDETPDLILLDIMMPDLTGFDVCQRLRADARTQHVPVIFLTALHEMEDHLRAVDLGGNEVLTKPINKLELLLRVKSLLRIGELTRTVDAQRQLIHDLVKSYVSPAAAARCLADPAVPSLEELQALS